MLNNNYEEISNELKVFMSNYFKDKIEIFKVTTQKDLPHTEFSLLFNLYDFFEIKLNYDRGRFGCTIVSGEYGNGLNSSQKWYDQADLSVFCREIDEGVRLRIPDKYLEHHGWKKDCKTAYRQ